MFLCCCLRLEGAATRVFVLLFRWLWAGPWAWAGRVSFQAEAGPHGSPSLADNTCEFGAAWAGTRHMEDPVCVPTPAHLSAQVTALGAASLAVGAEDARHALRSAGPVERLSITRPGCSLLFALWQLGTSWPMPLNDSPQGFKGRTSVSRWVKQKARLAISQDGSSQG